MSAETSHWLNNMTLIGMTDERGNAWHYRASEQGDEPNHYPGAIPVDDVKRRLFDWKPVEERIYVKRDGHMVIRPYTEVPNRKAISRSDTGSVLGIFTDGYEPHPYDEWLLEKVATVLDGDADISSAGLLKGGGQAWVEVSVPQTFHHAGVDFRPNLLACTSMDGSLATHYRRTIQATVCDNTLAAALMEDTVQAISYRHRSGSLVSVAELQSVLELVHTMADDFGRELEVLLNREVEDRHWAAFLEQHVPSEPDNEGDRQTANAMRKREALTKLYYEDDRVKPWSGTAWGVVQAVNTYEHHIAPTRKTTARADRNMARAVTGAYEALDRKTLQTLELVL